MKPQEKESLVLNPELIHHTALVEEKNIPHKVTVGAWSQIDAPVELGEDVWIGSWVHIRPNVKIGNWSHIRNWCFVEHDVTIGHNTRIMQYCNITAGCTIGSECFFGPGVIMLNDRSIAWPNTEDFVREPPLIGDGVKIGGNVTILPAVKISDGAVIGAGSVVTKHCEPWTVYVGNPARPIKEIPRGAL